MSHYQPDDKVNRTQRRAGRNVRRRPRNSRKPNVRVLAWIFIVTATLSCMGSYALQTPNLVIKEVRISGVKLTDRAAVEHHARVALGRNILLVHKKDISGPIRQLSEVKDVSVGRAFPDGILVRVTERKPIAVVCNGRDYCLVQTDGMLYHKVKGPVDGVPLVQAVDSERLREGRTCNSAQVRCGLNVVRCARARGLRIDKISVDPVGYICLNIGSGFYVRLGQPDDIAGKLSFLKQALDCRPSLKQEALYMDLSCGPNAYVWKPRSGSRPSAGSRS